MEVLEAIAKRHSYRGAFKNIPVQREDLHQIVMAGIQAPSGCNKQTTRFAIVDDPDLLQALADIVPKTCVKTASAVIVVISSHVPAYGDTYFDVHDYAAAVENMLLAITAMGYASVWLDGVLHHTGADEKIAALLRLPKDQHLQVSVILPVGVPEEAGEQNERLPFEERAFYNQHS